MSQSNHPYITHTTNGVGKLSNWLRLVCLLNWQGWLEPRRWWKSDPRNRENGGSLTRETIQTFHGHSGQIRKSLENVRQPLPIVWVWRFIPSSVWVQLYPLRRVFRKPEVLQDGTGCSFFYTYCSAMMKLDDNMNDGHVILLMNLALLCKCTNAY